MGDNVDPSHTDTFQLFTHGDVNAKITPLRSSLVLSSMLGGVEKSKRDLEITALQASQRLVPEWVEVAIMLNCAPDVPIESRKV